MRKPQQIRAAQVAATVSKNEEQRWWAGSRQKLVLTMLLPLLQLLEEQAMSSPRMRATTTEPPWTPPAREPRLLSQSVKSLVRKQELAMLPQGVMMMRHQRKAQGWRQPRPASTMRALVWLWLLRAARATVWTLPQEQETTTMSVRLQRLPPVQTCC